LKHRAEKWEPVFGSPAMRQQMEASRRKVGTGFRLPGDATTSGHPVMKKLLLWIVVLAVLAGGALFSGLANPLVAWQVKGSLIEAGVGEGRAQCIADRMVERLTLPQLWKLRQGMAPQPGEPENAEGVGELVKRLDRVGDGEAVAVLTTSAGLCAIGIG
jgi:hypothetical protein